MATNSNQATGGTINPSFRTLNDFKSRLTGGGSRPNLFECEINFPSDVVGGDSTLPEYTRFLVKAANLPASTLSVIDIPFRGRNLKIAGDRTFDPWSITIINDTDFKIRNAFEKWMNYINKHEDNSGQTDPVSYQQNMKVYQLGRAAVGTNMASSDKMPILKAYEFYGTFPTSISAIDLSYDSSDTIEEFTVDLQVQWWDALDPTGSSILGSSNTEQFNSASVSTGVF
jgi:hypothetical protein